MKRLAIVTTHPIQYYAPVFRILTERGNITIKVFYTWGEAGLHKFDPGFGKAVSWDIPLLDGYEYAWVHNTSKNPGSHHRGGIVNPSLIQDIQTWGADAVLVYGWNYQSHWQVMKHFKGRIPVLFRGDSTLLDEKPGPKLWLRRMALKWVYRHVDKALYVGTQNKRYFLAHGLREDQLMFAPHAVDNERFADPEQLESAKEWRKSLGYTDDDIIILYAGKFEPKKNPKLLLDAVQHFNHSTSKPWKLLMVGNGVLEEQLKHQALNDHHIKFLPFQNQKAMPALYKVGDVFCLPSQGPGETWGLAVNEALASEKTVVVSDRCGCALDLCVTQFNCIQFSSGSMNELISCLKKQISNLYSVATPKTTNDFKETWSFQNQSKTIEKLLIENH